MSTKVVKLDMNEMPYAPPLPVIEAAQRGLLELHRYADVHHLQQLRDLVARYAGVPGHTVVLSPGSDLLLREIIHVYSRDRHVLTVSPSFLPRFRSPTDLHISGFVYGSVHQIFDWIRICYCRP